jgi:hypothetical protein
MNDDSINIFKLDGSESTHCQQNEPCHLPVFD